MLAQIAVMTLTRHDIRLHSKVPLRNNISYWSNNVSLNVVVFVHNFLLPTREKSLTPVRKDTNLVGPSEKIIPTIASVCFCEGLNKMVNLIQAKCGITSAALHMPRLTGNCPRDAKTTGHSSPPADANKTGYSSYPEANWGQRETRPHMPRITGNSPLRRTMGCSAHPASVLLTVLTEAASVRLCYVIRNINNLYVRDDSTPYPHGNFNLSIGVR